MLTWRSFWRLNEVLVKVWNGIWGNFLVYHIHFSYVWPHINVFFCIFSPWLFPLCNMVHVFLKFAEAFTIQNYFVRRTIFWCWFTLLSQPYKGNLWSHCFLRYLIRGSPKTMSSQNRRFLTPSPPTCRLFY